MTSTQKKIIAENWLQSLSHEYKSYYVNLLQGIASNGGNVVESAYQMMKEHKQKVFNNAISKLNSHEIKRSMFPKGFLGWFSWLVARGSAPDAVAAREYRNQRRDERNARLDLQRSMNEAVHDGTLRAINNARFLGDVSSEIDGTQYRRY